MVHLSSKFSEMVFYCDASKVQRHFAVLLFKISIDQEKTWRKALQNLNDTGTTIFKNNCHLL